MKIKMKRAMVVLMAAAMIFSVQGFVYAAIPAPNMTIDQRPVIYATQGESKVPIAIPIKSGGAYTYNAVEVDFDITTGLTVNVGSTGSVSVNSGQTTTVNFTVDVNKTATTGTRYYKVTLKGDGYDDWVSGYLSFTIEEGLSVPSGGSGSYVAGVNFSHKITPANGFSVGEGNMLSVEMFNKGNTAVKNAELSITLPEGMSIYNGSNTISLGYLSVGQRKTGEFPIYIEDTVEGKTHPITVKISGLDYSNAAVAIEQTFYIPVLGDGAGLVKDLSIQGVNVPGEVTAGKDFNLSFSVKNNGAGAVKNMKVYVAVPEGILNKTTTTFIENSIGVGETKNYSVSMFAQKGSNSSYPIKIAVEPLSGGTSDIMQYVSVFVGGDGTIKTPQLMVDHYSYGGSYVKAGSEFFLNLGLYNTSGKTISNIKVTFSSSDGTFVPVDSSNSFFVDKIDSKGHYTKSLRLSSNPTAEQKTTALTVSMSYEDSGGVEYTAEDTISIPIMQEMRLMVDDIVPPYECYVGQVGVSQVEFYNMGKTTLGNLRVTAEGDFDVVESNSYYVGNMEGGKSDSYSFSFIPRQLGPMEGKLIFTYENAAGDEQSYEMPFVFEVMDMPVWEDMEMMPEEEKSPPWVLIIFGAVLVLAVAGIVVWRKLRKARLNKKLEIQDAAFDAELDLNKVPGDE